MNRRELSEKRFRLLFLLLKWTGTPLYMRNISIGYKVYCYLLVLTMFPNSLALFIGVVKNSDNLKRSMQNIRILFAFFCVTVTYLFLRVFSGRIEYLISLTEEFTWEDLPKSHEFRMTSWITKVQTIGKYSYIILLIFHYSQSVVRILTLQELVFDIWCPFDISKSPTFEIIIFLQLYASLAIIGSFACGLSVNCVLMAVATSQLEKLASELNNLKKSEDMPKKLRNWILYHQKTLRFIQAIEDNLSTYILVEMIPLFLGICLFAFSAITSWGDFTDQTQAFVAFSAFGGYASILCWFGTQLTESANNVKRAAWECDWVGTPIPVQKTIQFVIARGNKEIEITAGKFVPLSKVTLMHAYAAMKAWATIGLHFPVFDHWLKVDIKFLGTNKVDCKCYEREAFSTFIPISCAIYPIYEKAKMINNCLSMFMFLLNVKDRKIIHEE